MKRFLSLFLLATLIVALAGCSKSKDDGIYPDEDGFAEGRMGDRMCTSWFDFTVNSAYVTDKYKTLTASEGNELLVVDISVHNTFSESVPMFDTDFQAQWNDDADDAYAWPVENAEELSNDVLPTEYMVAVNATTTGLLVFEVPEGNDDFSISFLEYYEDGSEGDTFFVYFTADHK